MRADIVSLRLPPGTKLSEAEVARRYEVSRQPVREAFIRLGNMNLVQIKRQRGTIVSRISRSEILESRFVRTAVEVEIVRRACERYTDAHEPEFTQNLEQQLAAVEAVESDEFNALDYEFHRLICITGDCEFAFNAIAENKMYVDRLCMLSFSSKKEQREVYHDHAEMFERLRARDTDGMIAITRSHLSRLNATLDYAQEHHPTYFED